MLQFKVRLGLRRLHRIREEDQGFLEDGVSGRHPAAGRGGPTTGNADIGHETAATDSRVFVLWKRTENFLTGSIEAGLGGSSCMRMYREEMQYYIYIYIYLYVQMTFSTRENVALFSQIQIFFQRVGLWKDNNQSVYTLGLAKPKVDTLWCAGTVKFSEQKLLHLHTLSTHKTNLHYNIQ